MSRFFADDKSPAPVVTRDGDYVVIDHTKYNALNKIVVHVTELPALLADLSEIDAQVASGGTP